MKKEQVLARMKEDCLVAVVRAKNYEQGEKVVDAIIAGGINFIELTMTMDDGDPVGFIKLMAEKYKGNDKIVIGAGTVLDPETARACILAGANYIVSPGLNVDTIAGIVRKHLPEAIHHFPEEYITDRSQRFMASEIIREKLMRFLGAELPYSVTVEIERFQSNERGGYDINGLILVEREGQKKMVIGNKGAKIKTIGIEARKDMQEMFEAPVHLELWVKVKSGWADDERALRSLGYGEDQ